MGRPFDEMAAELRAFHRLSGDVQLTGQCTVVGATSVLGRLARRIFRLPKNSPDTRLTFSLSADSTQETWLRHFPSGEMVSRMRVEDGVLVERLGPVDLHFTLLERAGDLEMNLHRVSYMGVSCPRWLMPTVLATECGANGRLYFNIDARMPLVGRLVAYHGFLQLPPRQEG